MPDRTVDDYCGKVEIVNAIASVAMTVGLLIACLLLDTAIGELQALKEQMELRNSQGAKAVQLLDEAVKKLDRR